jgi:hypothetical protein
MPFGPLDGWVYKPEVVKSYKNINPTPTFMKSAPYYAGLGKGKRRFFWEPMVKEYGDFPTYHQGIGDCVGNAYAGAYNVIEKLEAMKMNRKPRGLFAPEATYALSRVEVGRGRIRGDGSTGTWAARAGIEYGSVFQKKYDKYDLTKYNAERSRRWGETGLPDDLEPIAKERLVKFAMIVTDYQQAIDLMACGFIIVICSNFGFPDVRDKNGFSRIGPTWGHSWYLIGFEDDEIGSCFGMNSWGKNWNSGPKVYGMPDGSWRIHKREMNIILGTDPDSYALSTHKDGFPERAIGYVFL